MSLMPPISAGQWWGEFCMEERSTRLSGEDYSEVIKNRSCHCNSGDRHCLEIDSEPVYHGLYVGAPPKPPVLIRGALEVTG